MRQDRKQRKEERRKDNFMKWKCDSTRSWGMRMRSALRAPSTISQSVFKNSSSLVNKARKACRSELEFISRWLQNRHISELPPLELFSCASNPVSCAGIHITHSGGTRAKAPSGRSIGNHKDQTAATNTIHPWPNQSLVPARASDSILSRH